MKGNLMEILAYFTQKLWILDDKGSRGPNMHLIFYAPPYTSFASLIGQAMVSSEFICMQYTQKL